MRVCVHCVFVCTDVDKHTCTQGGPGLTSMEIILYCANTLFTEVGFCQPNPKPTPPTGLVLSDSYRNSVPAFQGWS